MNRADEHQSEYSKDDLLPEYSFDYREARPNRFAAKLDSGSRIVTLDPDVAQVFTTPEAVNNALRALITAMPGSNPQS
jgi:hypothetical protein